MMRKSGIWVLAGALWLATPVMAEEAAVEGDAAAPAVEVTPLGEQVVTVNTGNETVDAAANYAAKCTERAASMKACESMGALKGMACKKAAEMRYKGVNCPL